MILRLTQTLNTKIKAGTLKAMPLDENPYADWSCHLFTADRTQYIIMSNTKSLYSCVMLEKGITDQSRFIERALSTIREFMEDDGQQFAYRKFIAPESGAIHFAKALNRSVTGSMNDLIKFAKMYLTEDNLSPHDTVLKLNEMPMSALTNAEGRKYAIPRDAFKRLLGDQSSLSAS